MSRSIDIAAHPLIYQGQYEVKGEKKGGGGGEEYVWLGDIQSFEYQYVMQVSGRVV
ncbi:hypothetical protein MD535_15680 [Vibrio sp. ZSDZ65]|uniref:Uncharacterized protein n=1 Tax=Vibrio qingdaonensis TaxID=2829491 RepID=A0A9X3CQA3_9VIBR|nr:hypothetical protein [Vibrio qingdaonensis]MCW8347440.1 hypothetical protein [Vibrio qingdaonensis]